jgi:hypothetical protein
VPYTWTVGAEDEGMTARDAVMLRVPPGYAGDADELDLLTDLLRQELLELDVAAVEPVEQEQPPDQAKGLGLLSGLLAVRFGGVETLRAVLGAVRSWAARTNREVEVSYGGDVLRVTGATSDQQEKIIDAWLARHAVDS